MYVSQYRGDLSNLHKIWENSHDNLFAEAILSNIDNLISTFFPLTQWWGFQETLDSWFAFMYNSKILQKVETVNKAMLIYF